MQDLQIQYLKLKQEVAECEESLDHAFDWDQIQLCYRDLEDAEQELKDWLSSSDGKLYAEFLAQAGVYINE